MTASDRTIFNAVLRNDLVAFIHRVFQTVVPGQQYLANWHIQAIAHVLARVLSGEIRRLIITLPPRNLKSIAASVAFPAFVLGHDPTKRIVCVSYSRDLTAKHARDCRSVIESRWYQHLFAGTRIDPRKNSEGEIETTARGYRLGTSIGGTLTGRGGNLIIIDDALKPTDATSETKRTAVNDWKDSTLSSRLDQKTEDAIIIVMQRVHVDDLVGHVLSQNLPWVHLNLPAITEFPQDIDLGTSIHRRAIGDVLHPEREPLAVLMDLKASMGSQAFSAQYQQAPVPPGGALIKRDWLRRYAQLPERNRHGSIVQSWDTASKAAATNDFSVCTTWWVDESSYYLIDVLRERLEFPDLRRRVMSHAASFHAESVLIEDAGSGMHLIQELRSEGSIRPIPIRPEGDKIMRLMACSPLIEAGRMLLPESAFWLDDFMDEILAFPYGRFDDQVDSVSQFLSWVRQPKPTWNVDVIRF